MARSPPPDSGTTLAARACLSATPARCQKHGGVGFVAAAGGQRVVLAVDEHGLDVAGTDADALQGGDLAVLVAVGQEAEPGAAQVTDVVEGLAHVERLRVERGWRRAPG